MRRIWFAGALAAVGAVALAPGLVTRVGSDQAAVARTLDRRAEPEFVVRTAVQRAYPPQKVVYQISDDGGTWNRHYISVLNNVRNHLTVMGKDNVEIVVVTHSDGVNLLQRAATDQRLQGYIANLKEQGVKFVVCAITLRSRRIDPDTLFEVFEEDIVPSGVVEIVYLQQQGYGYLRP